MSTHIIPTARLAGLAACAAATLLADFSYQENMRITGGAMADMLRTAGSQAREPTTSTVLVKGNRMAHIRPGSAQITDLDKETLTNINFTKKTYTVMTFAQMSQMMQDMSQRMGRQPSAAEPNFKAAVRDTGKKRTIQGFNASEKIVTITMGDSDAKVQETTTITTDMWIAPDIPGYAEVRNFYRRMMEKKGMTPGGFGALPGASEGMAAMAKEMSKMNGVPILQVMSMSGGGTAVPAATGSGITIEMTTESSGFSSSPVDPSKFEVPAGFQLVEPNTMRRGRK